MPHKTFFAFILPSLVAMLLFIALPIVSVVVQSFYVEHGRVLRGRRELVVRTACITRIARIHHAATQQHTQDQRSHFFPHLAKQSQYDSASGNSTPTAAITATITDKGPATAGLLP